MSAVLRARGLGAVARGRALLAGVDLDASPGAVTAVIGESGSGKTTLGLALQGEYRQGVVLSGSVCFHGVELVGRQSAERRAARATGIGYLPQHPGAVLNPVRRVGSVLSELAAVRHSTRRARQEAIDAVLQVARLDDDRRLLRRRPHELSGGQQQRVALAQALVAGPAVLVLDEPATGLDLLTKSETAATLDRLTDDGLSIVLCTHDLRFARRLADTALVLREGRMVERGSPRLLSTSAHPYTRKLLDAAPRLSAPENARDGRQEIVLSARSVAKKVDGGALLDSVGLDVPAGRCVAVVGRSGAGKSTLARCLAGLTSPDSGAVVLHGVALAADIRRREPRQRMDIQYVHQDARASFDEFRSVLAQVARTAQVSQTLNRADAKRAAVTALASLGLSEQQCNRRPAALSGGQLQRAALARALLARPAVLVCDEVTAGQDMLTQSHLLTVLSGVSRISAVGVVLISHDLFAVCSVADEIHVLDAGRFVERGPAHDVLSRPRTRVTQALVGAMNASGVGGGP